MDILISLVTDGASSLAPIFSSLAFTPSAPVALLGETLFKNTSTNVSYTGGILNLILSDGNLEFMKSDNLFKFGLANKLRAVFIFLATEMKWRLKYSAIPVGVSRIVP